MRQADRHQENRSFLVRELTDIEEKNPGLNEQESHRQQYLHVGDTLPKHLQQPLHIF